MDGEERDAEEIGLKSADRRRKGVSYTIHWILTYIEDEQERFAAILTPPENKAQWTPDDAGRRVGNKDSRGYDAGKKINRRKRHLVVGTRDLPLLVMVTPASLTDRDAAEELLFRLRLIGYLRPGP